MRRYKVTRDMRNKEVTLKTLMGATREYNEKKGFTSYYFDTWNEEAHDIFTRCMNDDTLVPTMVYSDITKTWKEDEELLGNLINASHGNYYICLSNVKAKELYYFLFDTIEETEIAWDYYAKHSRAIYVGMFDEGPNAYYNKKRGE